MFQSVMRFDAQLAPMRRPDIDGAVHPSAAAWSCPAMRMIRGVYRRRRLTVPTLVVLGRRDRPWTEDLMGPHLPQSGAGRRPHRVRLRRRRSAFHHRQQPRRGADLALDWFKRAA
jgi:hypothetical protein